MSIIDIIKSFLPLVVIFLLLFGVLLLVKKYSFSISGKKMQSLNVNVIHNQLILPKKYLSLVRVQDKILLLGISENNITLLKEMDDTLTDEDDFMKEDKPNLLEIFKQNLGIK
jgi:flagellar protein FliO/FliZ